MSIKGQGHWWKVKAQTCYHDNFLFRQSFMQIFLGFYFSYVYIWNGNWRQWKNVSPGLTFLDIFLDIQWMYIPSNVLEKNIYIIYICQCRKMCNFFFKIWWEQFIRGFNTKYFNIGVSMISIDKNPGIVILTVVYVKGGLDNVREYMNIVVTG